MFDVDLSRISRHINAIYNSKELEPKGTLAENAIVQKEGTCPLPEKGTKKKLFLSTFLDKYPGGLNPLKNDKKEAKNPLKNDKKPT